MKPWVCSLAQEKNGGREKSYIYTLQKNHYIKDTLKKFPHTSPWIKTPLLQEVSKPLGQGVPVMDLRYPTSHLQCFHSCIYIYLPNLPQENEHSRGKIASVFIQDYTVNNKCALAHTCTHTYLQAPVHTYTLQYKCACAHLHIFFKKEKKETFLGWRNS